MNLCADCGTALNTNCKFCPECGSSVTTGGVEELGNHKAFTKGYVILLAGILVTGLAGIGIAHAVNSGGGGQSAYDKCIADPTTSQSDCNGLDEGVTPHDTPTTATLPPTTTAYEACIASEHAKNDSAPGGGALSNADIGILCKSGDCYDDASCAAAEAQIESGSGGTNSQPATTCLEWKTNYSQRYVPGTASNGASYWNGSSWVQSSPGTPGHYEQVPTGQTCVRSG